MAAKGLALMTHLHETASAEVGLDQGLGDPAGRVRRRAVHLGEVLAGEGAAAVRTPTAVCVDDNFAARQARVPLRNIALIIQAAKQKNNTLPALSEGIKKWSRNPPTLSCRGVLFCAPTH